MTITAPTTLDPTEVQRLLADDPTVRILDVRTGGEFDAVHIPGSHNVPLDTLGEHASELARLPQQLVLVCRSGARSSHAEATLRSAGCSELLIVDGGIDAWQTAGAELAHGDTEKWALDRQVRLVAGSISLAGILASVIAPRAKWLSGGVAAGLTFSAVSNTCAMGNVLAKLPYNRAADGDVAGVVAALRAEGTRA